MTHNHTQTSISPTVLAHRPGRAVVIVDVRKPAARRASGAAIAGAVWRHPVEVDHWADEFKGRTVAVYCVHGHEVSQTVRSFLTGKGIETMILEGGFEAWQQAGLPVEALDDADA
ncbi:rhodanese-like domain-containing protein [Hoeflea sp. YIM 152468]|uniref:rhodanese-like domain-containing protein n=1 Tax=Hoeflea sp. YIM 152468 TaxID=3031759 RepID=UPI0023DA9A79|nr:rhodanese-like domain-containing protein [Hoeflea sp. YIM 152468]MDF1609688.1 rhodanese-like domain-containing protein [Hoeflea sp. YIM 152468]